MKWFRLLRIQKDALSLEKLQAEGENYLKPRTSKIEVSLTTLRSQVNQSIYPVAQETLVSLKMMMRSSSSSTK
jgi:hypothetical protein